MKVPYTGIEDIDTEKVKNILLQYRTKMSQ